MKSKRKREKSAKWEQWLLWAKQTQPAEIDAIYCPFEMEGEEERQNLNPPSPGHSCA